MPELPEVETVKRSLKKLVQGKKITDVVIKYPNIIAYPDSKKFIEELHNQTIHEIKRRGKWLMFELDNYILLSHLRMEGKYVIRKKEDSFEKHEHIEFIFDDGTSLRYKDVRKFGRMYLYPFDVAELNKPLNELGLEPWDSNLTISYLKEKYKVKKIPIKTVLLDQGIIVGIGNIYADEILFLSHINPYKKACDLKDEELNKMIQYTKEVLEHAIELGGTTIRTYESSEGVHGLFQQELLVHNQKICSKCNGKIIKEKIGGRGTYYCPNCQR